MRRLHRLAAWRPETALRRRLVSVGQLLSGNAVTALIAVAATALAARTLGAADYGILAMIISFTRAIERLMTFQSWQPLIKYGAELDSPDRLLDLRALLKFGLMLDMAGAVLAWLVATSIALAGEYLFDWSGNVSAVVLIYCLQLLFNINGTPTAILRLYGRFGSVAYVPLLSSIIRLICCVVAAIEDAGIETFVLIWMGTNILGWMTLLGAAFHELHRRGIHGVLSAPLKGVAQRFPGIWGFAWSTNLSLTIQGSANEADTLLVGSLADPASAGLYHIAKRFGRMTQQLGVHVQAVLYPDVARLWAKGAIDAMLRAVRQVEMLLAACGMLAVLTVLPFAERLLDWMAGPDFVAAAPLLIAQMIAAMLMMTGFGARSALLAMGCQRHVLSTVTIAIIVFYATALVLIPISGALGASIAHIILSIIWLTGLIYHLHRAVRKARSVASKAPPASETPPATASPIA